MRLRQHSSWHSSNPGTVLTHINPHHHSHQKRCQEVFRPNLRTVNYQACLLLSRNPETPTQTPPAPLSCSTRRMYCQILNLQSARQNGIRYWTHRCKTLPEENCLRRRTDGLHPWRSRRHPQPTGLFASFETTNRSTTTCVELPSQQPVTHHPHPINIIIIIIII